MGRLTLHRGMDLFDTKDMYVTVRVCEWHIMMLGSCTPKSRVGGAKWSC